MRLPRCSRSVISARKQESGRRSHRFPRRQRRSDPGKKAEARVPPQIAESENILDTGSEFITMINCRPFRPNLRGFCSFFLRPKTARHNERYERQSYKRYKAKKGYTDRLKRVTMLKRCNFFDSPN